MTAREFLEKIIKECPSRGLDNIDIYITEEENSFDIRKISNEKTNDGIFITLRRID